MRTSLVRTYLLGAGSRWRLLSEIYDVRFFDMLRKSNLPTAGGHILQPLAESLAGTRRKKYNKTVGQKTHKSKRTGDWIRYHGEWIPVALLLERLTGDAD